MFVIYEDLLEKADRGPKAGHLYKRRWKGADGKWHYEYDTIPKGPQERKALQSNKDWKPPTERYDDREAVDTLISIGDWLFGLQAGAEHQVDFAGFNRNDMDRWRFMAGQLDGKPENLNTLKPLLSKYKRQISAQYGLDEFYKLGLQDWIIEAEARAASAMQVEQRWKQTTGDLILSHGRVPRKKWQDYVATQREFKQHGLAFDGASQSWYIRADKLATFPWDKYTEAMGKLGFEFGERPDPPDFKQKAKEEKAELKAQGTDAVIEAIKNRRVRDTIAVTVIKEGKHKGKVAFFSTYSPEFNTIFSNKTGVISGITEYNPNDHSRLTTDIRLAKEALERIKERLPNFEVVVDQSIQDRELELEAERVKDEAKIPEVASKLSPGIDLFPFQNAGVRFIESTDGNCLIGDEMGLGKTIQTLSYLVAHKRKALVICPKVVRKNWLKEAEHFFPGEFVGKELISSELTKIKADIKGVKERYVDYLSAKGDDGDLNSLRLAEHYSEFPDEIPEDTAIAHELGLLTGNLASINYENVEKFLPYIKAAGFDTMVVDESHRIKNPKAKRTKMIKALAKTVQHRILLSGTAVKNKKVDLYEQIELVSPGLFSSPQALKMSTHGEAWHKLQGVYRARTKREVLRDMPEKTSAILKMDVKNLPAPPADFGEISKAKSELAQAKVPTTVEFVKEMLESSDSNVLVFTDSVPAAEEITRQLGSVAVVHHGQTSDKKREEAISKFDPKSRKDNETVRVFVATTGSAGIGINLQTADKVVFNDLPWTPSDLRQAEDRAHRVGITKGVNVYWMVAEGHEFDESIADILKRKFDLAKKLQEGKQLTPEEREWMDKGINPADVLAQMRGETVKPKASAKFVIKDTKTGGQTKEPVEPVDEPDYGPRPKRRSKPKPKPQVTAPAPEPTVQPKKAEEHTGAGSQPRQLTLGGESQATGKPVQMALFKSFVIADGWGAEMERVDRMIKAFDFDGALDLIKAAGHKYLRRIPTGKQKPKYRYIYRETSKHHRKEYKVGEKLQITHGEQKGHYEVTEVHANGYVTIKHDESGHYLSMKADVLHEMFQKEHDAKIKAAHKRLKQTVEAANKYGSEKQKAKARIQLAEFERRWGVGRFAEKGPAPKMVVKEPEKMAARVEAPTPEPKVEDKPVDQRVLELAKQPRKTLQARVDELRAKHKQLVADGKAVLVSEIRELRLSEEALALATTIVVKPRGEKRTELSKTRFPNKEAAYKELMAANSRIDFGQWEILDGEYKRKGRKGMSPAEGVEGFDYLNHTLDLEKPTKFEKRPDNRVVSLQDWFDRYMAKFHPGETQWWAMEDVCHHLSKVFPGFSQPDLVQKSIMERTVAQEAEQAQEMAEKERQEAEDDARVERDAIQAVENADPDEVDTSFDFGANIEPEPETTDVGEEMAKVKIAADAPIPGETDQPEPKPKAKAKATGTRQKRPSSKRIEATGDHIWGSRKDLERIENITSSKQLESMNYDDAVQLVRKKNLVPAHDLQTLKALGMSPGTAHMTLALLAAIVAKPGDSKEARSRYVDEVHAILGSMKQVKNLDDFRALLNEMDRRQRTSPKWETVHKAKMMSRAEIGAKIAELQKDNPNVEYRYRTSYYDGSTEIVTRASRPYDCLGRSFVSFISQRGKKFNDAFKESLTADNALSYDKSGGVGDGWKYLEERGSAKAADRKAKSEKAKARGKTKKKWTGANIVSETVKREGANVQVKDANPERVKKAFNLREVDYGQDGYMSQADREEHTKALEGALHDFSEVLGIDPKMISLNGRLGIAMGARGRGKAAAHYEPGRFVINITKFRGGGSLAHEWGHALDNLIATINTPGDTTGERMHLSHAPESSQWPESVRKAYVKVHNAMHKHPDPVRAKKEHQERINAIQNEETKLILKNNELVREHKALKAKSKPEDVEKRIKLYQERNVDRWQKDLDELRARKKEKGRLSQKDIQQESNLEYWIEKEKKKIAGLKSGELVRTKKDEERMAKIEEEIEDIRLPTNRLRDQINALKRVDPTASRFAKDSAILGRAYWGTPHEMFARAFETFVQDELHGEGRDSTYLVDGPQYEYPTGKPSPHGGEAQPYPQGEEREAIRAAMREFIDALKGAEQFEKALRFLDDLNTRFVIPLELARVHALPTVQE